MTNLADFTSCTPHEAVPSRLIDRLLARLRTLRPQGLFTVNPEEWSAYMRRDVGLSDHDARAEPDYPSSPFDWLPR